MQLVCFQWHTTILHNIEHHTQHESALTLCRIGIRIALCDLRLFPNLNRLVARLCLSVNVKLRLLLGR
jgi:hypothetical protein